MVRRLSPVRSATSPICIRPVRVVGGTCPAFAVLRGWEALGPFTRAAAASDGCRRELYPDVSLDIKTAAEVDTRAGLVLHPFQAGLPTVTVLPGALVAWVHQSSSRHARRVFHRLGLPSPSSGSMCSAPGGGFSSSQVPSPWRLERTSS